MSNEKRQKGFTLLESIVAVAVFTIGISVSINLISSSLANAGVRTRDKIIAGYLAQEGIETVRSIRDNNWIAASPWRTGIPDTNNGCVQWDSNVVDTVCSAGYGLTWNPYYTPPSYRSTAASQFFRTIGISTVTPDEMRVTATTTCGTNCTVSLSEYLYNWK